jgi:hypothetical protein
MRSADRALRPQVEREICEFNTIERLTQCSIVGCISISSGHRSKADAFRLVAATAHADHDTPNLRVGRTSSRALQRQGEGESTLTSANNLMCWRVHPATTNGMASSPFKRCDSTISRHG